MTAQDALNTQDGRDGHAMIRLREAVPTGWTIDAQGPITYRYGVVDWEVEVCDPSHAHCDRASGSSLADAANRCREALGTR